MRPVIFFAYANDGDQYLDSLKEESRSLERILRPLHQKEVIELYIKENVDSEDIYDSFIAHDDRITIFHYAGHADKDSLLLNGTSANAEGLAELFATQKENLKLVFLNGCSTYGQVKHLLSLGIRSVIATSQSISDVKASKFSKIFYQSLTRNNTLSQAFTKASAFLKTQYSENASVFRTIDFSEKLEQEDIPWGLYIKGEDEEILRWRLPQYAPVMKPVNQGIGASYQPNLYFNEILSSMKEYDPSINANLQGLDRTDYLNTIIEKLPYPIAVQFQKLVSSDLKELNRNRLQQILSTYLISSKLIYFFLLSQLWDEQHNQSITSTIRLGNWHNTRVNDFISFDYALEADKIYKELLGKVPVFLKEYESCHQEFSKEPLRAACEFLQGLKSMISEMSDEELYPDLCKKAETCLSLYLKSTAFLVGYELYGIRDVYLHKPRYESEVYKHRYALLKLSLKASISVRENLLDSNFPTDNNSVILLRRGKDNLDEYLSLSPFVIDKNAFSARNDSEIFFMVCRQDQDIVYHRVKSSIYKAIKDLDDQIHTNNRGEDENPDYFHIVNKQVNIFELDFNLA